MAATIALPEEMELDVKQEGLAETDVSILPDFPMTKTRQLARQAHNSAAAATNISDGMPATPYSLPSLPATPPFETVEFDAEKDAIEISATVAASADKLSAQRSAAHLMNETPSDSASEPQSEQVQTRQTAINMYRFRPEFLPARRSPPGQSRDQTDSPEPISRRESSNRRRSSRKSLAEESLIPRIAPLSPSTAEDSSEPTDTIATLAQLTPSPADDTVRSEEATPSAADESIASRRPMRTVRQAKPVVQDSPRQTRPAAARPAGKADSSVSSPAPAHAAAKAKNTSPTKSRPQLEAPQPVERRATRRSGLPLELAPPQPVSISKRRRSESDKNLSGLARELQRLEDTKEYKHVDENPVVYTVWSNGKYVPANAAGEPLPDKTKRAKSAKDADSNSNTAAQTQDTPIDEEATPDAPRPVQKRFKKWMAKGLYSGQSMPKSHTAGLTTAEKKSFAKLPELSKEYPPNKTLPMPIYNGLRMLLQGRDFKLPFDVFNPLPPGQPKPVKYGKINKNRFVGDAHAIWKKSPNYDDSLTKCVCKKETGCDDDCQNRIMLYECNDMICNVGAEHCNNREFQRLAERTASKNAYNIGVEVFKTPNRGHGIRSSRSFRPGQIIMEYIGEIITEEESDRRMNELYKDNECYYLMSFDQSLIIDGTSGSVARFVNHSCDPNCRMIKWLVSGQPRIALFAGDRPIQTGEELTYDYNFDPYSSKNVQGCLCGSENCRGVLGPRKSEKSVSKAAAAAEKADKKGANGSSKRKHDVYSVDDDEEDAKGGPASKKMRTASGQQQTSQAAKKVSKAPAPKAIMTTKAALEALAADVAKKARLEKASKAAKAARAAKAAKLAEELKAAEAKKAKAAKAAKAARAAKAKAATAAKVPPSKSKTAAGSKASKTATTAKPAARGSKATTTKAAKPIKVVKAVQPVKVVKTSKGLKAAKTSKTVKVVKTSKSSTEANAAKTKTTATAKAPARVRKTASTPTKSAQKSSPTKAAAKTATKPTSPQAAKTAKAQKPKASLAQRAVTPQNDTVMSDSETTPQATPMAQAVAKAAKEAAAGKDKSPAKAHKSVKFVKKPLSQLRGKPATNPTITTAKKVAVPRRRQVPKKVLDITQAVVVKKTISSLSAASTPSDVTDEEEELAAQLYMEAASSKLALQASASASARVAPASKGRAGRISKPTATARSGRRVLGRPRGTSSYSDAVSEEIEEVSMFDDDSAMNLGGPIGAEDTIHVARSSR